MNTVMHDRTKELHELMEQHHLKAGDVGALLGRTAATVRIWRVQDGKRPIPPMALELLKEKLKSRTQ